MFSYFGAKWRLALKYPEPRYDTIVETHAGSACYASRYAHKNVILCEAYEPVAVLWDYLIHVSEAEILALPDLGAGSVDDFPSLPAGARYLIGFWCNAGVATPRKSMSSMARSATSQMFWGELCRARIARQLTEIRHWQLRFGDFRREAPIGEYTYFIDPPYEKAGYHYGAKENRYSDLAWIAQHGPGQRIVCEAEGAKWLPFQPLAEVKAMTNKGARTSREVYWHDGMCAA